MIELRSDWDTSVGARRIFPGVGKLEGLGMEIIPTMVQRRNPGGGMGVKPPETDDMY